MKLKIARLIKKHLSGPEQSVPGDWLRFQFGEIDPDPGPHQNEPMFTASTSNDGYELWIAYTGGKWLFHCWKHDAVKLAWFILWDWYVKATWFGAKRRVWYWANRVELYATNPKLKEWFDSKRG